MRQKLLSLLFAVGLCLSLAACGEKEPFITLDSTEITVNSDGTFAITGTADPGTTLEVGGARPTLEFDGDTFAAYVQMGDPVDSAVLTATCYSDTLEFTLTFDTTAYVEALEAAQAQAEEEQAIAQAQAEETSALEALEGTPLTEAMTAIQEYGYTATYFADGVDFTDFIEDMADDYTTGTLTVDAENKTVEVELILTSALEAQEAEAALEEKLSSASAWTAVQNYGEALYPYGFDLHSILGRIAQEMEDEDTWFLKATCDVTNEYGATGEFTCEAKVTGTTESPEIVSFIVY